MIKKLILTALLSSTILIAGTFVMKKGEPLSKTKIKLESNLPTPSTQPQELTTITKIDTHLLKLNEIFILENKYIHNIIGKVAVTINGEKGTNQTVIIRNSKFYDVTQAIRIVGVDNIIIEGNYFEKTWSAIKIYYAKSVIIKYNKSKNHGVLNYLSNTAWSGNFAQIADQLSMEKLEIEHNLIDRSQDNRPNAHANTFAEDYINAYRIGMVQGKESSIGYNYIIGSELNNESITAGAITIDQYGDNHKIHNNVIYNTGSFNIGVASSRNIKIIDNIGFQSSIHDAALMSHAKHHAAGKNNIGPNRVSALTITNYMASNRPTNHSKDITITGNKLIAIRGETGPNYSNHWLDIAMGEIVATSNSFSKSKSGGPIHSGRRISKEEMEDLVFGSDKAGLFETHGKDSRYFNTSSN